MTKKNYLKAVDDYVRLFNAGDAEAVAALYSENAQIFDPVGTPPKTGLSEIRTFYEAAVKSGAQLALTGPVRLSGLFAVFPFQVSIGRRGAHENAKDAIRPFRGMTIDVIDSFEFDSTGKIKEMRAFWGPENITKD